MPLILIAPYRSRAMQVVEVFEATFQITPQLPSAYPEYYSGPFATGTLQMNAALPSAYPNFYSSVEARGTIQMTASMPSAYPNFYSMQSMDDAAIQIYPSTTH